MYMYAYIYGDIYTCIYIYTYGYMSSLQRGQSFLRKAGQVENRTSWSGREHRTGKR